MVLELDRSKTDPVPPAGEERTIADGTTIESVETKIDHTANQVQLPASNERTSSSRALSIFQWIRATAFSSLLRRIVVLNLVALFILVAGISFLNQFRAGLIDARVESLLIQGKIIAGAISASATVERDAITIDPDKLLTLEVGGPGGTILPDVEGLDFPINPQNVAPVLRQLISPAKVRARIYDRQGELILDSQFLYSGGNIQRFDLPEIEGKPDSLWDQTKSTLQSFFKPSNFPVYEDHGGRNGRLYPEVAEALKGNEASVVRIREEGQLIVSVAVPVQRFRAVLGALFLSTEGSDIDEIVQAERLGIFRVFLVAAVVTVLLSVVLAGTIATPLKRLSAAADNVRTTGSRNLRMEIPEFNNRTDEVGHLSHSLREMTEALYNRMDAIGQFAADVSHELKNPLTSLRSAVETLPLAKTDENKRKLLAIIQHDVQRLDRLITDISDASRLDAELARENAEPVCIGKLAQSLVELSREVHDDEIRLHLNLPNTNKTNLYVDGHDGRLGQVINNLLDNSRSFVPANEGEIRVTVGRNDRYVEIHVEDNGPGIDPAAFEHIFRRFYTDRPGSEEFGRNSGLGLSICKQIVEAHSGTIRAENIVQQKDGEQPVRAGARFIIQLPARQ